jgi:D-alanyl-D-alanine carboxypeptidase
MGKRVQFNYNTLIGRYPGADGMKTGFICASGFNLVASATRDDKRLIAVVLGAPSSAARAMKAAQLLERGFSGGGGLAWLMPSLGTVETLPAVDSAPPNLRDDMCGGHRKRQATEDEDEQIAASPDSPYAVFLSSLRPKAKGAALTSDAKIGEPVLVYTGVKPPAPGAAQAGWNEGKPKPEKKKTATARTVPGGKDQAKDPAAKETPKEGASAKAAPKETSKEGAKSGGATPAAATGEPKPKPKKPAPKTTPAAATSATQQTTQTR